MKKFSIYISIILCVLLCAVCFAACSVNSEWIRPEVSIENQGYTVQHVTNMQEDFEFPIKGVKLDHSNFERERLLEYSWVIKNSQGEVVGWIDIGSGYDSDKKGNYKYGYSASESNGVYGFGVQSFCLILKADISVFDSLTISSDCGEISKLEMIDGNPYSATRRYTFYDEENNVIQPLEGSADFVCCYYQINFAGVDPKKADTFSIIFNIPDLVA